MDAFGELKEERDVSIKLQFWGKPVEMLNIQRPKVRYSVLFLISIFHTRRIIIVEIVVLHIKILNSIQFNFVFYY